MRIDEILIEKLSIPVKWKWTQRSSIEWIAVFKIKNVTYTVSLFLNDSSKDLWELAFTAETSTEYFGYDISGTGKALTVFGTVIEIAQAFIAQKHPKIMLIVSADNKRHMVNTRIAQAIARDSNYVISAIDSHETYLTLASSNINEDVSDKETFKTWFSTSKIRDENGIPLVVYHGSDKEFEIFLPQKGERGDGGIFVDTVHSPFKFFSADINYAHSVATSKEYYRGSGNVLRCFLRMLNPVDLGTSSGRIAFNKIFGILERHPKVLALKAKLKDMREDLEIEKRYVPRAQTYYEIFDALGKRIGASTKNRTGDGKRYKTVNISIEQAVKNHKDDILRAEKKLTAIENMIEKAIGNVKQPKSIWAPLDEPDAAEKLIAAGYDGLIFVENSGEKSFAVIFSNQIKSVKNKGEFSLASQNINEAAPSNKDRLKRAKKLGFDISEPVFHGTRAGGFTEFKTNYRKNEQLGFGIHVTPDRSFAERYAHDEMAARKGKNPVVMACYLRKGNVLDASEIVYEGSAEFDLAMRLSGKKLFIHKDEDGKKCVYMQNAIDGADGKKAEKLIAEAGYDTISYNSVLKQTAGVSGFYKVADAKSYVVLKPENLRSVDAEFDLAKSHSSDLMA